MLNICDAQLEPHRSAVRALFIEYAATLDRSVNHNNLEHDIRELPGEYAPPGGRLLIAYVDEEAAGCVALRSIAAGVCEMKRMYVRPDCRGRGIGRELALAIIGETRGMECESICLDTWHFMTESRALYASLGFVEIPPYRLPQVPGTVCMELRLR